MNDFNNFNLSDDNYSSNDYYSYDPFGDEPKEPKAPKVKKEKKPAGPMMVTKSKLFLIIVLAIVLAFGGAFGGMYAYNTIFPTGANTKSSGSIKGNGYTLEKATGSSKTIEEVAEANKAAVVEIKTEGAQSDQWMQQYVTKGAGSGVIIKENGYIITNNHVVENSSKITVTLSNEKSYEAKLVGTSAENDIAVIKINASKLPVATYGNAKDLKVGDMSVIIGNPLGELGGTVTAGIISALDRDITIDGQPMTLLQTDASVNPGNSGGGMFDQYGHLIGIVVAKSSGSDVEGLGFAIPINRAADIASQIMKNGKAKSTTAYSGMEYTSQGNSVFINKVLEDFAKKAGFKAGDQVLAIDDTVITSITNLSETIKKHKAGDKVTFMIARNGQRMEISIELQTQG